MAGKRDAAQATQKEHAERAMAMKADAPAPHHPSPGRTASEGMQPNPNANIAPSGALDAEGQRPVIERSRKVR